MGTHRGPTNGVRPMTLAIVHWRRAAAWATAAITIGLLGVALFLTARGPAGISWSGDTNSLSLLNPLISVLVGAIIIDRKGNHPVGWLFCLSGLGSAFYYLGFACASYVSDGKQLFGQDLMIWSASWSSLLAFGLAPVLVFYVFPTGRLTSPRWRWFFGFAIGAIAIGTVARTLAPGPLEDFPSLDNPYGIEGGVGEVMLVMRDLVWPLLLVSIGGGVVSLRQQTRQSTFDVRQQIKWILLAGVALLAFIFFWGVMETLGHPEVARAGWGFLLPSLPIAVAIAILKYRLYDIDILINRTLVYATLSAVLGLVYFGAVVLFQGVLSPITAESDLVVAAATLSVAALFRPLRAQTQRFIDRRFYRQKYDMAATLESFSTRLRDQIHLDALTDEVLTVVGETLQPSYAGLWLKATSEGSVRNDSGTLGP